MVKIFLTLLVLLVGPARCLFGQEGPSRGLATPEAVLIILVTVIVIGGLILYEYVRVRGMR